MDSPAPDPKLRAALGRLESTEAEHQRQLAKTNYENQVLVSELSDKLASRDILLDDQILELNEIKAKHASDVATLRNECNRYREENAMISEDLITTKSELTTLHNELSEFKAEVRRSKKAQENLEGLKFELETVVEELQESLKNSVESKKEMSVRHKELCTEIQRLATENERLNIEKLEDVQLIASLQNYVQELKQIESPALEFSLNSSFTYYRESQGNKLGNSSICGPSEDMGSAVIDKQLTEALDKIQAAEEEHTILKNTISEREVIITELSEKLASRDKAAEKERAILKNTISGREVLITELSEKLASRDKLLDDLYLELKEIKARHASDLLDSAVIDKQLTEALGKIQTAEEEHTILTNTISEREVMITKLSEKLASRDKLLDDLHLEINEIKARHASDLLESAVIGKQLTEAFGKIQTAEEEHTILKNTISEREAINTELSEKLASRDQELDDLYIEINEIKARHASDLLESTVIGKQLTEALDKIQAAEKERAILKNTISGREVLITELSEKLASRDKLLDDLYLELKEIKARHASDLLDSAVIDKQLTEALGKIQTAEEEHTILTNTISEREVMITKLSEKLASRDKLLDDLHLEINEIKARHASDLLESAVIGKQLTEALGKIQTAEEEHTILKNTISEREAINTELSEKLASRDQELDDLYIEINEIKARHASDLLESTVIGKQLTEALDKIQTAEEEHTILTNTISEKEVKITELSEKLASRDKILDDLYTEINEIKARHASDLLESAVIDKQLTEALDKIQTEEEVHTILKNTIREREGQIAEFSEKLASRDKVLDDLYLEISEIKARHASDLLASAVVDKQLTEALDEIQTAEKERTVLKSTISEREVIITELSEKLASRDKLLDDLYLEINEIKARHASDLLESSVIGKQLTEALDKIQAAEEEHTILKNTISEREVKITELSEKLASRDKILDDLYTEINEIKARHASDLLESTVIGKQLTEALDKIQTAEEEHTILTNTISEKEVKITELSEKLASRDKILDDLYTEINEIKARHASDLMESAVIDKQLTEALDKIQTEEEEHTILTNTISEKEVKITELSEKLASRDKVLDDLYLEINEIKARHASDLLGSAIVDKQLTEALDKIQYAEKERTILKNTISEKEVIITELSEKLASRDKVLDDLYLEISEIKARHASELLGSAIVDKQLTEALGKIQTAEEEHTILTNTISEKEVKITELSEKLASRDKILDDLYTEINEIKARHASDLLESAVIDKQLTEALDKIQTEEEVHTILKNTIREREVLIAELSEKLASRDKVLDDLHLEISEIKARHASDLLDSAVIDKQLTEALGKIQTAEEEHTILKNTISEREVIITELSEKLASRDKELDDLYIEINEIKARHASDLLESAVIGKQLTEALDKIQAAEEEHTILHLEINEIKARHASDLAKAKDSIKEKYLVRFEETKEEMKKFIVKLEADLEANLKTLRLKTAEVCKLCQLNEELKEQIEDLKREKGMLRAEAIEYLNKIYQLENSTHRPDISKPKSSQGKALEELHPILISSNAGGHNTTGFSKLSNLSTNSVHHVPEKSLSNCSKTSMSSNSSLSARPKAVPSGSGSLFTCEDEDFNFSEKNKVDLKRGRLSECCPDIPDSQKCAMCKLKRKAELNRRNTMVAPHLRDCYSSELNDSGLKVCDENLPLAVARPGRPIRQDAMQGCDSDNGRPSNISFII